MPIIESVECDRCHRTQPLSDAKDWVETRSRLLAHRSYEGVAERGGLVHCPECAALARLFSVVVPPACDRRAFLEVALALCGAARVSLPYNHDREKHFEALSLELKRAP